ncbi:MAG: ABC transporter substrate-binding protein [Anaerolineales bacterium]|nr:ABC transporter substrate-binding protein [Anaerolineales bacterium]
MSNLGRNGRLLEWSFTKKVKRTTTGVCLISLLLLGLADCGGQSEPVTLKIALLPIMDTLPIYVAQEQGYFAEEGVVVEFVPVASAPDRDQLIKAGQADGMVNELLSTMFYNSQQIEVSTVRYARKATAEFPHFSILAAASSGITSPTDLAGREIGISEATIIEYSTDRLLQAEGLSSAEIKTVAVPRIPDRLALLGSGELVAANLPDPASAVAALSGAIVVVDDSTYPEYGHSVITFRKEVIDEHPEAIRGFLNAIEKAVADINNDKTKWNNLLSKNNLLPPPLMENYVIPDFPTAGLPDQAQWDDMLIWAQEKGYVSGDLAYADSVDASYLPR